MGSGPTVFISYRRADAAPSAGRVHDELRLRLGAPRVFMDVDGQLSPGDVLSDGLREQLERAGVLVVVVGPGWVDARAPTGGRRLDEPADWVRAEVERALAREIPLIPVLVEGAGMPAAEALPESLRPLTARLGLSLDDARWAESMDRLYLAVVRQAPELAPPRSSAERLSAAITALTTLRQRVPEVAARVAASAEVLGATVETIACISAHKSMHDWLQAVEAGLRRLGPKQRQGIHLRPALREVQGGITRFREHQPALGAAFVEGTIAEVDALRELMESTCANPTPEAWEAVQDEVTHLLATLGPTLDRGVCEAGRRLELARLAELFTAVREAASGEATDAAGLSFVDEAVGALRNLGADVDQRVEEHDILQRLDTYLREIMGASAASAPTVERLGRRWRPIVALLDQLPRPGSSAVAAARPDFAGCRQEVERAFAAGDAEAALLALDALLLNLVGAFQAADGEFVKLCEALSELAFPLRTLSQRG